MSSAKLAAYVIIRDEHGRVRAFGPDDDVPAWAAAKISNPAAWQSTRTTATAAETTSYGPNAKASKRPGRS